MAEFEIIKLYNSFYIYYHDKMMLFHDLLIYQILNIPTLILKRSTEYCLLFNKDKCHTCNTNIQTN